MVPHTKARMTVYLDAQIERDRQDFMYGVPPRENYDPYRFQSLAIEEVGEVARALNDHEPLKNLYTEVIQTAALYMAWAEHIRYEMEQLDNPD